jgi:hypothetical protein
MHSSALLPPSPAPIFQMKKQSPEKVHRLVQFTCQSVENLGLRLSVPYSEPYFFFVWFWFCFLRQGLFKSSDWPGTHSNPRLP